MNISDNIEVCSDIPDVNPSFVKFSSDIKLVVSVVSEIMIPYDNLLIVENILSVIVSVDNSNSDILYVIILFDDLFIVENVLSMVVSANHPNSVVLFDVSYIMFLLVIQFFYH